MFRTRIFSALCSTPPPPQWNDSLHWWESVVWRYCSWRPERIFLIFILCLHNVRNIAPTSPVRYQCIDRAGMLSRIYVQSGLAHPDSIVYYCSSVCLSVNQPPTSPLQIWRPHFSLPSSLPSFSDWGEIIKMEWQHWGGMCWTTIARCWLVGIETQFSELYKKEPDVQHLQSPEFLVSCCCCLLGLVVVVVGVLGLGSYLSAQLS